MNGSRALLYGLYLGELLAAPAVVSDQWGARYGKFIPQGDRDIRFFLRSVLIIEVVLVSIFCIELLEGLRTTTDLSVVFEHLTAAAVDYLSKILSLRRNDRLNKLIDAVEANRAGAITDRAHRRGRSSARLSAIIWLATALIRCLVHGRNRINQCRHRFFL